MIVVLFIYSCIGEHSEETRREDIGNIIEVKVIPTSFNELQKIEIRTDKVVVVIRKFAIVRIGAKAYLIHYEHGSSYITWDGSDWKYMIMEGRW